MLAMKIPFSRTGSVLKTSWLRPRQLMPTSNEAHIVPRYLYIIMRGVCSLHLPSKLSFRIQCFVFYHLCTYFFVAYCCRGILLIFFYYNVWRIFVALRICACIMQFAFEFNASAFYNLCMYYSFEFNASDFYHLCMYYPPFSLHLYIICHHVHHNIIRIIPFLLRSTSRARISFFLFFYYCMIIQASASLQK